VGALVAPATLAGAAWITAGKWQTGREQARRDAATKVLASTSVKTPGLDDRLAALGVQTQLAPDPKSGIDPATLKQDKLALVQDKQTLASDYVAYDVELPNLSTTIFVHKESAAARWAITIGAAAAGLALAVALAVALLNRWVLRPLAGLAADADRIAGGELAVEPVDTRAREVADVGEAMHGMAQALASALTSSQRAESERRFLVSAIAHDLRTPLFTLRGSLEALERNIGTDELGRAQRKAAHLDRLIDDLFAFARADYAPVREPVELAEIARAAADAVDGGSKAIVVAGGPAVAHGDPVALRRALTNLIENAVRHARTRVHVIVQPGSVTVADDGDGFAAEDLPHVFEPLFRGDRARAAGGAGLGLAIARRLARAHDGEVEAANAPSGGARVTLVLP
jgi:signal transduction histidine kinase